MTLWKSRQLRYVLSVTSGATPDSSDATCWDGNIPWITPEDVSKIKTGYRLLTTRRCITQEGYESCGTTLAPKDSIVLTKRAPIGQLAVLDVSACSNQGCFLLTPKQTTVAESRYYFYFLLSQVSWLQALGRGSTFMELSTDDIKSLHVPVPEFNRQIAIANYLDRETARLDELIMAKEHYLAILAEKRRALTTHACTQGLNPKTPQRDSGIPWHNQIPTHWEAKKVKYLFRLVSDPAPPDNDFELLSLYTDIGVRPRRELEARGNKSTTTDNYWLVRPGDLVVNKLLAWMGAFGVSTYEGVTSPAYDILRPIEGTNSTYYHYLFRCGICFPEFRRRSTGIMDMRLRLYFDQLGDMRVPVPPIEEQGEIVSYIVKESAKLDDVKTATERTITLLKERRGALIAEAVSGQIEVI